MTQSGVVTKLVGKNRAVVSVKRGSACGASCASCGGSCSFKNIVTAEAVNTVKAAVGDSVTIESSTRKVLNVAFLVYIVPLITFFLAYGLAMALRLAEVHGVFIGIAGLFGGLALVVLIQAKLNRGYVTFEIIAVE